MQKNKYDSKCLKLPKSSRNAIKKFLTFDFYILQSVRVKQHYLSFTLWQISIWRATIMLSCCSKSSYAIATRTFSFPLYALPTFIMYWYVFIVTDLCIILKLSFFWRVAYICTSLVHSITGEKPPIDVFFNTPNSYNSRYWRSQSKTRQQQPSFPPLRPCKLDPQRSF